MTSTDKFGIALAIGITVVFIAIAASMASIDQTVQAPVSMPTPAPVEEAPMEETMEEAPMEETMEEAPMEETVMVSIPKGSSTPGCEATEECFIPSTVTTSVGSTVIWTNDDSAAHTVTSGTAADGPDGIFDSSIFMSGKTFEFTFDEAGSYDYFCVVHPWMTGKVIAV
jgi:plastocyanin